MTTDTREQAVISRFIALVERAQRPGETFQAATVRLLLDAPPLRLDPRTPIDQVLP